MSWNMPLLKAWQCLMLAWIGPTDTQNIRNQGSTVDRNTCHTCCSSFVTCIVRLVQSLQVYNTYSGTRPSRLRSMTQSSNAEPNQMSTSNSESRSGYQGSPSVMTHPHMQGLTVRTHVKSDPGSDGTGSGRTPGSVNIRVWKVCSCAHFYFCHDIQ